MGFQRLPSCTSAWPTMWHSTSGIWTLPSPIAQLSSDLDEQLSKVAESYTFAARKFHTAEQETMSVVGRNIVGGIEGGY